MVNQKVQQVQGIRRSNAADPIPSRKPERRGGRAGQRRSAIAEQRP